jgi:hypothetical protein
MDSDNLISLLKRMDFISKIPELIAIVAIIWMYFYFLPEILISLRGRHPIEIWMLLIIISFVPFYLCLQLLVSHGARISRDEANQTRKTLDILLNQLKIEPPQKKEEDK